MGIDGMIATGKVLSGKQRFLDCGAAFGIGLPFKENFFLAVPHRDQGIFHRVPLSKVVTHARRIPGPHLK